MFLAVNTHQEERNVDHSPPSSMLGTIRARANPAPRVVVDGARTIKDPKHVKRSTSKRVPESWTECDRTKQTRRFPTVEGRSRSGGVFAGCMLW